MVGRRIVAFNDGGVTRFVDPDRPPLPFMRLDYQTGDLSQWGGAHYERPEQISVGRTPQRAGYAHSARFEVQPTDYWVAGAGTIRGEVHAQVNDKRGFTLGDTHWYAWSTFLPDDFSWPGGWKEFFIYTQLHVHAPAGKPAISFRVTPGLPPRLNLQTFGGALNTSTGEAQYSLPIDGGELPRGEWVDHLLKITWGDSPDTGRISLLLNGEPRVENVACANIYTGYVPYMKQGIYASATTSETHVLYHTGTVTGSSISDVRLPPRGD